MLRVLVLRAASCAKTSGLAPARAFTSTPTIRRPKAVKVKKSEARRRVEPKPVNDALTEVPEEAASAPTHYYAPPQQQAPQTFGGAMKESFLWGIGMALAFTVVGVIFSSMEEAPVNGPAFDASLVVVDTADDQDKI